MSQALRRKTAPAKARPAKHWWQVTAGTLSTRHLMVLSFCLLAVAFVFFAWRTHRHLNARDTEVYYRTAIAVRNHTSLYEHAAQWREGGWIPGDPRPEWKDLAVDYPYAPPLAIAFVPLTVLPFSVVAQLWFGVLLAALLGTAWLLAGLLPSVSAQQRPLLAALLAVLLMVYVPIRHDCFAGNCNTLLLLLLTLSLTDHCRGRAGRAGVWLALAATVKLTLLCPLAFFLLHRSYRTVAVAVGVVVGLLVLSAAVVGVDQLAMFFTLGDYWTSDGYAVSPFGQSPNSLLLRLFTANVIQQPIRDWPWLVTLIRGVGLLIAGSWLLWIRMTERESGPVAAMLGYGATLLVMLLVAPFAELPHFTFLAILLVGLVAAILRAPLHWSRRLILLAGLSSGYAFYCLPGMTMLGFSGQIWGRITLVLPTWAWVNAAGIGLILLSLWVAMALFVLRRATRYEQNRGASVLRTEQVAAGTA